MPNDQGPHPGPLPEYRERENVAEKSPRDPRLLMKRRLLIAAEVVLVLVIVALLALTWLPAFIGPRPGVMPSR